MVTTISDDVAILPAPESGRLVLGQRVLGRDRHDFAVEHRPVTAPINQEPQSTGRPDSDHGDHRTESEGNQHGGHHRLRRSPARHPAGRRHRDTGRADRRGEDRGAVPDVDLEQEDTAEGTDPPGADLPGADLSGEVLTMPVVRRRADEFTCTCFLVQHRSRIAGHIAGRPVCLDCA